MIEVVFIFKLLAATTTREFLQLFCLLSYLFTVVSVAPMEPGAVIMNIVTPQASKSCCLLGGGVFGDSFGAL